MNILAALAPDDVKDAVYNVAVGDRTSLNQLFSLIKGSLHENNIQVSSEPVFRDFRAGDVRHSQADINKAITLLGYCPTHTIEQGIKKSMSWYIRRLREDVNR